MSKCSPQIIMRAIPEDAPPSSEAKHRPVPHCVSKGSLAEMMGHIDPRRGRGSADEGPVYDDERKEENQETKDEK